MRDYSSWMEAAAEESIKIAIRSSMDIASAMRRDADDKQDVDHEKLDMLMDCWHIIKDIKKIMVKNDVDGHTTGYTNGSVSSSYKTSI